MNPYANQPGRDARTVSPSDTVNISGIQVSALYVSGAGNLRVLTADGTDVTLAGIPAGAIVPIQVLRVFNTGTTATAIVAIGHKTA